MAEDYYAILGVERSASADDIKRAYRKLAHQHHPDKSGGNEEKFKKINEAYQILSDEKKKAQYDQFGSNFDGSQGFGGGGYTAEDFGGFGNFNDIFNDFFGGGRQQTRQRVRRGEDIGVDVTISFIESAQGLKKEMIHSVHQTCSRCKGNMAEPGTAIKECPTCKGLGYTTRTQQTILGTFAQQVTCGACHGEGKKPEKVCTLCRGEGREYAKRSLSVEIPAGIADGQMIRITGKGEAPRGGGLPGDLFVTVHVKAHATMKRDGDNIRSKAIISFVDAALGTSVHVETLMGKEFVSVPAGTQPGTELKLDKKGFPSLQSSRRGDHIVTVHVEIPKRLSREQKDLLEQFKTTKKKKSLFF